MPKTRSGEQITWKEFMERWKLGIQGVTPLQQMKAQIQGTYISLAGIILGIVASALNIKNFWWVIIILIGGFVITASQLIGLLQRYKSMKMIEDQLNDQGEVLNGI